MKRLFIVIAAAAALTACCCGPKNSTADTDGEQENKSVYVVDCNGGGDFTSVQECLDALPSKPTEWRTVRIMPGVYREKVTLDVYKDKVALVGEGGADSVRIVWNDHTGKVADNHVMTTYDTWTFSVQADDVYIKGVTIENDAVQGTGQAVALETRGDRILLRDCALIGNQDTFFTKDYVSRVRVQHCYIEGTTDFIFGPSIVLFEDCTIHCKQNSYITAASTTERNKYGYVFSRCRVTAADNVTGVFLGRPWKSTARTVWLECELPAQIKPAGWHNWGDPSREKTSFYAEWRCTGEGADRSQRAAWSHELTDEQAAEYTPDKILAKKTGSEQFHDDWSGDFEITATL